jgi:NAD(P)-dependent dehydrogenase (short-subunit alcohol dehydrogenase family)
MAVAIVTGGSKGFGKALADGLVRRGWSVVIDARDDTMLARSAAELREHAADGASVEAVAGDVTDASHREALVETARRLGGLDLLVNNASTLGATPLPALATYPLDDLRTVWEVNVVAPLALIAAAVDLLRSSDNPRVLDVTSDASVEAYEGWGGYGSSKAALDHAGRVLAEEEPWLSVWALDPGDMRTDMHQAAFPGEDISDRPLPESVVPVVLALIESDRPSGRVRASDLSSSTSPSDDPSGVGGAPGPEQDPTPKGTAA